MGSLWRSSTDIQTRIGRGLRGFVHVSAKNSSLVIKPFRIFSHSRNTFEWTCARAGEPSSTAHVYRPPWSPLDLVPSSLTLVDFLIFQRQSNSMSSADPVDRLSRPLCSRRTCSPPSVRPTLCNRNGSKPINRSKNTNEKSNPGLR